MWQTPLEQQEVSGREGAGAENPGSPGLSSFTGVGQDGRRPGVWGGLHRSGEPLVLFLQSHRKLLPMGTTYRGVESKPSKKLPPLGGCRPPGPRPPTPPPAIICPLTSTTRNCFSQRGTIFGLNFRLFVKKTRTAFML